MRHRFLAALGVVAIIAGATPAWADDSSVTPGPDGLNLTPTAAQVTSTCDAAIARADAAVKAIVNQRSARTFQSVVLPLENATADLNDETAMDGFAAYVAIDKDVRDASNECATKEANWSNTIGADPKLERAVAAASKSGTARNVYDKKLTSLWLTSLVRSGAGLPTAKRAEFVKLSDELSKAEQQFNTNLFNADTKVVFSKAEIAGIPDAILKSAGKPNADGSWTIAVNESTYPVEEYATAESARKKYYMAYDNIGYPANVTLLERAIAIRDRLAHLLGYETWAAYVLADRMAGTPARVETFLSDLDAKALPKARADKAVLRQLKVAETGDPHAVLQNWDTAHFSYILTKTKYSVDPAAIRQYFPVQHTIDAILNIYHTLLGVDFAQVKDAKTWAPDVFEYTVTDTKTGKLLGYTYFDIYPRPGKYNHFANFGILPHRSTSDPSRVPVAVIVGNWPKPGPGEPALLSHDDVVTFFHEFGHDMAALLGTAPYETLSSGFKWDFVEAPSQMLENFQWQPSIIKQVSSNYKTGAPMPDDMIEKLIATRYVDYGLFTTGQIMYSDVDMAYHTSGPHVDTTAVWEKIDREVTPNEMVPGTHPQAAFGHLMSGYDAGYYGYLWSKVYAQDMFTAFLKGGLENPAVGMRYREDILEPARTYEPDVEVTRFLGRPMSPAAFDAQFATPPPKK